MSDFIARFPIPCLIAAWAIGTLGGAYVVALCFAGASRDNVLVMTRALRPADPARN